MDVFIKCSNPDCKEPLPTFYGRRKICKTCLGIARRAKYKADPSYKEKLLSQARAWAGEQRRTSAEFRAKEQARTSAWAKAVKYEHRPYARRSKRNQQLVRTYGITIEVYEAMLASQNNCCAGCGRSREHFANDFGVDHCHVTGKNRGILCFPCNILIGYAKDSPELLRRLADYLEKHQP